MLAATLKKLGFIKQNPVLIMNPPEEFRETINAMGTEIHLEVQTEYSFIMIFVQSMLQAQELTRQTIHAIKPNGHFWLCYPKSSSPKYKVDITRKTAWEVLAPFSFEPVSQVAIDKDWSALRFKPVDEIKSMTRKTATTAQGRERIKSGNM